jgi:succinoglycan biosynthesis transport protein ExoP
MLQPAFNSSQATPLEIEGQAQQLSPPPLLVLWQILVHRKKLILAIIAAFLVLGLIATLLISPKYTAVSRIEISRTQKNITNVQGVDALNAAQDQEFYQTQYSLMIARSLAERVARQLRLSSRDEFFEAHDATPAGGGLFGGGTASKQAQQARERQVVNILLNNVNISPIRGSALVDVGYTSSSPQLSAEISNAWVQQFIQSSINRRFASTADARKFLEGRLLDLRTRLEQSERDLVNYASERDIVSLGSTRDENGRTNPSATLVSTDLATLNAQLAQATADRISAQSRMRASAIADRDRDPTANGALNNLREKRADLSAEYARLMVQFQPSYPAARSLEEQIRALDTSIAREESRLSSKTNSTLADEYQAAVSRERSLAASVAGLKSRFNTQQRDSIQFNIYQREADTNRQLYDALLQRYKEIGVSGVEANNISVVDTADVPQRPSSPKLSVNLALALLLGAATALAIAFILDRVAEGLRTPDQVRDLLKIPLLGSVPDVDGEPLEELADVKSALYEAYFSVVSNLAFSTDHGVPRTLLITSTRASEGKSTTSLAIAAALQRTGKRVILLDGDMRSPSIHGLLGLSNEHGLSNFLAGLVERPDALVQKSELLNINVIAAGPQPPNAAELFAGDRMVKLLDALAASFDHVVIDAPPLLGLADSPLLSRYVEGVVFVMQWEGVALRGLKAGLDRLRSANARILGGVLTRIRTRSAQYGYGYDYGYGYGGNADSTAAA